MSSFLFDEWVKELDKKFEKENRKVILIVDNCSAHPIIEVLKAVELVFLPPNTISKTQQISQKNHSKADQSSGYEKSFPKHQF